MPGPNHDKPALEPKGGNPSEADRLHTATETQSPVTPEQYTQQERDLQVDAATGRKRPERK